MHYKMAAKSGEKRLQKIQGVSHLKPKSYKHSIKLAIALIIILIALSIFLYKKPSITGKAVLSEEAVYSENLNLQVNESKTYTWQPKNPGSIKSLKATGSVTSNGTARVYIEKGGERYLLLDSKKQLFDIDIHVLPEYKNVFQGDSILIQIELYNLRGFGSGNVNVTYSIKNSNGDSVAHQEETIFVETRAKFVRTLEIPSDINPGTYVAAVEVLTDVIAGAGSDTFEIKPKYELVYQPGLKYYIIGIFAIIAFVVIFSLVYKRLKTLKKKQKIEEIEIKAPQEKIDKLENELKALEEAYKSNFISQKSYEKDKERIERMLKR